MPRTSKGTRKNASHKAATLPAKPEPGFIKSLDGRTELARALRARFEAIASDLGGVDSLSHLKASLVERTVWLEANLQTIESRLAEIDDPKVHAKLLSQWTQGLNALIGCVNKLGTERVAHAAPWIDEVKA